MAFNKGKDLWNSKVSERKGLPHNLDKHEINWENLKRDFESEKKSLEGENQNNYCNESVLARVVA